MKYDVIIVGAGAAGLMCAIRAGQRGKKVLLLDHAEKIGAKILISGGGRCNFTNLHITPNRYISNNPHFCISALKNYTQHDFIALVEKHKITYHEKTLGQLFCDHSAQDILDMLVNECHTAQVDLRTHCTVSDISKGDVFTVATSLGIFHAAALVLATGGLSIPKIGATDFAHRVARQFKVPMIDPRPALVPLMLSDEGNVLQGLSGVSLEVTAHCGKTAFREGMVATHRGVSGPAILQISSYWREGDLIALDLLPDKDAEAFLLERKKSRPKAEMKTILGEVLPHRLAEAIATHFALNTPIASMTDKKIKEIAAMLKQWSLTPTESEGYGKAEVTLGGIDTSALSSKTMAVKNVSGLYFIGEAVDVTGWLGGYNFQWAWSSGWASGSAL